MNGRILFAVVLAAVMIGAVFAPMGTVVADDNGSNGDEVGLEIDVEQNETVTVTVTDNNSTVENATVNVTVDDENVSYADEGNYTTDENGTVSLDTPEKTVNVTIKATHENASAPETVKVTLEAEEDDGIGDHENFGSAVSAFVHDNMGYAGGPFGQLVSEFVTTHNPGVGPADHAGPPGHVNFSDDEQGPPEHAGGPGNASDDDGGQGPPDHAGPNEDDKNDE